MHDASLQVVITEQLFFLWPHAKNVLLKLHTLLPLQPRPLEGNPVNLSLCFTGEVRSEQEHQKPTHMYGQMSLGKYCDDLLQVQYKDMDPNGRRGQAIVLGARGSPLTRQGALDGPATSVIVLARDTRLSFYILLTITKLGSVTNLIT